MYIQSILNPAWEVVQLAHCRGFLHNHDMFVFAFCRVFPERILTTYDGRQRPSSTHRPNFFIWHEGETSIVTFFGKIRFAAPNNKVIENDLFELNRYFGKTSFDVLTDAEKRVETQMMLSPEAEFGYFLLTEVTKQSVEKLIQQCLTEDDRRRCHFAFGSPNGNKGQSSDFSYQPPLSPTP